MTTMKKIKKPKDLEKLAEIYFQTQEEAKKPCSIPSIAYFLGFSDKKEFLALERESDFAPVVKKIKLKMESQAIEMLFNKAYATTGVIFNLKCAFGYNDKIIAQEVDDDIATLITNAKNLLDEEISDESESYE